MGSPETVAAEIPASAQVLGLSRSDLGPDTAGTSVADRARTVELLGTAVRPLLQDAR